MVFGLLTALCWGAADFLIRVLGARLSVRASIVWAQGLSALIVLAAMLAGGVLPFAGLDRFVLLLLLVAALANAVGQGLLYAAFQHGRVAVVAPLVGAYAIVATGIGVVAGTEILSLPLFATLALIGIGALLVMFEAGGGAGIKPRVGALAAAASAVCNGVSIWWVTVYVLPHVAMPDVIFANFAVLTLCALAWPGGERLVTPGGGRTWAVVAGIAVGTVAGYAAYNTGLRTGGIAVVSVLSTLSSGVTLLLARLTLGEKVHGAQRIGLLLVILGLPLLAAVREF